MPSDGNLTLNFIPAPPLGPSDVYNYAGETNNVVVGDYAREWDYEDAHLYGAYFPSPTPSHPQFAFLGWFRLSGYRDLPTPVASEWLLVPASEVVWGLYDGSGTPVNGARNLMGRWGETVTLDPQGGSAESASLRFGPFYDWPALGSAHPSGMTYGSLPVPVKAGHEFLGWWTGPTSEYPSAPVSSATPLAWGHHTLYAHWNRLAGADVAVTFSLTGGASSDAGPRTYTPGGLYGPLPSAVKEGMTFAGWHTQPDGGTRVYADWPVPSASHTLYARWTAEAPYAVVYFLPEGGALSGQTRFEYSTATVYGEMTGGALPVPARTGYAFRGWWTAALSGGVKVEAGYPVPAGNTQLHARWEASGSTAVDDLFRSVDGWVAISLGNVEGSIPAGLLEAYRGWLTEAVRRHRLSLIVEGVLFDYRAAVDADNHPVGSLDETSVPVSLLRNVLVTVWYSLGVEMSLGAAALLEYRTGWLDSNVVLRSLFLELRTGRNRFRSGLGWSPTYSALPGVPAAAGYPSPVEPEVPPISYNPPPG
ncbi:MAG: InlB B-repeat-containing protein [Kiritimatiellae bacterium]|nr:InlB B-repeat-containing protein [Kiritimatiellia bacterium]